MSAQILLDLSADESLIQLQILAAVDAIAQQGSDPFLASSQRWALAIAGQCKERSAWAWLVIWLLLLHIQPRDKAAREDSAAVWLAKH